MKGKLLDKVIAIFLVFIMTFSYWGMLASKVYAEYIDLETQETKTNNKNVQFDVYFKQEDKKMHEINSNTKNGDKAYINLNVNNGYLKQVIVNMDNPNFVLSDEENLKIEGTQITVGEVQEEQEIELPFNFLNQELVDLDYFSRETKVTLSAIYVDKEGKEIEISSEKQIKVNWEDEIEVYTEQKVEKVIDLGSGRVLMQTNLKLRVKDNNIPVESTKLEIKNPEIENVNIEEAKIYAIKTIEANGIETEAGLTEDNWKYDPEEAKIIVNIENPKIENNKIAWKKGEDEFKLIYIIWIFMKSWKRILFPLSQFKLI